MSLEPAEGGQSGSALPDPRARNVAAFAAVAVLGVATALIPPYTDRSPAEVALLAVLVVALLAFAVLRVVIDRARTYDRAVVYGFFVVLAIARDLTGGVDSQLAPLLLVPVLWLALTGRRGDLVALAIITPAFFLLPIVVIGGADYPWDDWRRAAIWALLVVLVFPSVQQIVSRLAGESARLRRAGAERDGILRAARLTSMISTDREGVVRSFSPGAEDMLGCAAAEVIGVPITDLHDPAELAAAAGELGVDPGFGVLTALAQRQAPSRIWTYLRRDGERLFVRAAVTELRAESDELVGYLVVSIDATAGVRAERALAQADARWRIMTQRLPDTSLLMLDQDLRIELVAGSGMMRTGLVGAEGKLLSEVSNPRNTGILAAMLGDAFEGRESTSEVKATLTGSPHEVMTTPLPPDGETKRALLIARDVSEERIRESALVTAKERAERLFADAPNGVVVLGTDGVVVQMNGAMEELTGFSSADLATTRLDALTAPGFSDLDRHLAAVLVDGDLPVDGDWTLRDRHGNDVQVAISSRVLRDGTLADDPRRMADQILMHVVDVSERKRYEERLAHLADHDALTGLANRRRFDRELQRHLDHCARYGPRGALLVLDLDRFKEVNDTLGHGAGDQLIVSAARVLRRSVRGTDVVARLGGDEFAVLMTEGGRDEVAVVAQSIVDRIRAHTATLEGTRRRVTASVGAVPIQAASQQAADLLALADLTMYDAKEAGRNRFEILADSTAGGTTTRSGARLAWKSRIEQAIEHDHFELRYQPIRDLRTGEIASAEALLRMRDGDELVLPSRFLYVAERSGLAPDVDAWVLRHSVEALAALQRVRPGFRLEVNLSGLSIGERTIETALVDSLAASSVDPSSLVLEITETAAVADVEVAREFAERVSALGCKFALDDFGAGFGSFYYLKHLLFDYVKIDGEFVASCHRTRVDRSILRSIVGIARDLGKETVAEFVSDPAILEVVRAEGVDHAQGHLIGTPVPFDELVAHLGVGRDESVDPVGSVRG